MSSFKTTDFLSGTHQVNNSNSNQVSERRADQSVLSTHRWHDFFCRIQTCIPTNIYFISTCSFPLWCHMTSWLGRGMCGWDFEISWLICWWINQCRQKVNRFQEVKLRQSNRVQPGSIDLDQGPNTKLLGNDIQSGKQSGYLSHKELHSTWVCTWLLFNTQLQSHFDDSNKFYSFYFWLPVI